MRIDKIVCFIVSLLVVFSLLAKPRVWVYTDMSDPTDRRQGGHPQNDPDDICTMASFLLQANEFDIGGIVYGSTNRKSLGDPTDFVQNVFVAAYTHDRPFLEAAFGGYPEELPFMRSSITQDTEPIQFNPKSVYAELEDLESVAALIDYASEGPVYVLCWGPLTEAAIAVQHCLSMGKREALNNMTFIAHWTKSWIAQGTPEAPFKVANCRDDWAACVFLHEQAKAIDEVKYIELGSVGQSGIVNGGENYPRFDEFQKSRLGQIFINSKFYHGKPDQSDGSTFWLLRESFGVTLDDYKHDGTLTMDEEKRNRDGFKEKGYAILDDLFQRSDAAAVGNPFEGAFIADYFTYVYQFLNGRYYIYVPYDATYQFLDTSKNVVKAGNLVRGNHQLDLSDIAVGDYAVIVDCGGINQEFSLSKTD